MDVNRFRSPCTDGRGTESDGKGWMNIPDLDSLGVREENQLKCLSVVLYFSTGV